MPRRGFRFGVENLWLEGSLVKGPDDLIITNAVLSEIAAFFGVMRYSSCV